MVFVFLADGFEEVEALTAVDYLRRAGLSVSTVGVNGRIVRGSHGIPVVADLEPETVSFAGGEAVILPGGMPGSANLDACEPLRQAIMAHYSAGKPLAAICAAPMVYGHLGILDGVRATCYPGVESELLGAVYTASIVEQDGQFITGKGPAAAFEFGYTIAESFLGVEAIVPLRQGMIYAELTNG